MFIDSLLQFMLVCFNVSTGYVVPRVCKWLDTINVDSVNKARQIGKFQCVKSKEIPAGVKL